MRATGIIFRREFRAYTRSPMGYIVAAVVLLLDGILFYALALGPRWGNGSPARCFRVSSTTPAG